MSENQLNKEDQLFIHLVNTFVQSAWISLGKVKNPVSDELERNVDQASYYIDLLDMLQTKMKGNLSEWEEQYILHSLSELKLNYIDEKKKKEPEADSIESKEESGSVVKNNLVRNLNLHLSLNQQRNLRKSKNYGFKL
jgi:hypothetical protein